MSNSTSSDSYPDFAAITATATLPPVEELDNEVADESLWHNPSDAVTGLAWDVVDYMQASTRDK